MFHDKFYLVNSSEFKTKLITASNVFAIELFVF